jgi:hypothetical protein
MQGVHLFNEEDPSLRSRMTIYFNLLKPIAMLLIKHTLVNKVYHNIPIINNVAATTIQAYPVNLLVCGNK